MNSSIRWVIVVQLKINRQLQKLEVFTSLRMVSHIQSYIKSNYLKHFHNFTSSHMNEHTPLCVNEHVCMLHIRTWTLHTSFRFVVVCFWSSSLFCILCMPSNISEATLNTLVISLIYFKYIISVHGNYEMANEKLQSSLHWNMQITPF